MIEESILTTLFLFSFDVLKSFLYTEAFIRFIAMNVKTELSSPKQLSPSKKRKADDLESKNGAKYQKRVRRFSLLLPGRRLPTRFQAWTDEEEDIFLELVRKAVTDNMWALAKADGRLVHRGSDGIKAHVKALVNFWPSSLLVFVRSNLLMAHGHFTSKYP